MGYIVGEHDGNESHHAKLDTLLIYWQKWATIHLL